MLSGYNTNVPHKGETYHVQTEDGGRHNPFVTTHIFHKGAILGTEKAGYADLLIDEDWTDRLTERMKEQHRKVVKSVMEGRFMDCDEEPCIRSEDIEQRLVRHII